MPGAPEPDAVKLAQRELYEAGEYHALSAALEPAAAVLVEVTGVDERALVLDVAAGDGNVALAAVRRGATVFACDLSAVQVERGRHRTEQAGARVEWAGGDAEALPWPDASFTHVLSAFGAVFAPRPYLAATELFRVCRPGGRVAVTAWPPDSLMGEATALARRLTPAGRRFPDLELGWGDPLTVRARLAQHGDVLLVERRVLPWDPAVRGSAGEADCAASFLRDRLDERRAEAFAQARAEIVRRHTTAEGTVTVEYLLAAATKR
jgi:SAM-dependent methyltransferase